MTTSSASPTPASTRYVILAAIDDSASAQTVVHQAATLAATIPGARLHLVHVADSLGIAAVVVGGSPLGLPSSAELLKRAREHLVRHAEAARHEASGEISAHLCVGTPWREIVQLATNIEADLLVIGTHDAKGLERLLLGSRAEVIVRAAPCAVLVARPKVVHREGVPEIEPPCADCISEQRASNGARLWCARHAEHHARAHVYGELPDSFGVGSQTFRDE